MRAAARIAAKDLKLRLRDRSAFIIGIVAPLALAFISNLVFGSAFDPAGGLGLDYGMVDRDKSELSGALTAVLLAAQDEEVLSIGTYDDADAAELAIQDGAIDAFFLIESGFEAEIMRGGSASIGVTGDVDAPTSTQIAASIAEQFATGVEAAQLAVATTATLTGSTLTPAFIARLTEDPSMAARSYELADVSAATRQLDPATYFSAAMAVFFLFFTVQFGVLGLLEEERDGTLPRLRAAPISRFSVVAGKAILAFTLGVVSMGVLAISTQLLMGADWGAPLGVLLLIVSGVLAAIGILGLVAATAKTSEGAGNLGAIIAVVLGMLGGVFFQIGRGDDLLSLLTFVTPHAWFMRGLGDLAGDAAWTAALPATGAILVFAVVTGGIAWVLLKRRLVG